jgi:glycosyltransferase involved in cell wall biosynthesis
MPYGTDREPPSGETIRSIDIVSESPNPMDILQVHSPYRRGGGEDVVVEREAAVLRSAGHRIRQHLVPNPSDISGTLQALAGSVWNPRSYRAGVRFGGNPKPDVAHVHNTWFALSPSIVSGMRRAVIPIVMTLHNFRLLCVNGLLYRDEAPCTDCVGRSPIPGVVHRCYHSSSTLSVLAASNISLNRLLGTWVEGVDIFVAMTEFGRQMHILGGIPPDRIVVKPHFAADPGEREGAPSSSPTVLYVGRVDEEKGLSILLEAWSAAAPRNLELVVIGEGPRREDLENRNTPSVRFVGALTHDRVVEMMLGARALIFPSQWFETFGLVVIEALASGLPVLASNLGGNGEVLTDLGEDWLVSPTDTKAWVESLTRLSEDSTVDRAGAKARASYQARYSEDVGLSNLEGLYQRALSLHVAH